MAQPPAEEAKVRRVRSRDKDADISPSDSCGVIGVEKKEKREEEEMSKYINADELLKKLPDDLPYKGSVRRVLMQAPGVDVFAEIEEGIKAAVAALAFENNPVHRMVKRETYSSMMYFIKSIEERCREGETDGSR